MAVDQDLVGQVRRVFLKPKGYRVFFASGLNQKDVQIMWEGLTAEEKSLALQLYNVSFGEKISSGEQADAEKLLAMCNALFDTSSNVSSLANVYAGAEEILAVLHSSPIEEGEIQVQTEGEDVSVELKRDVKSEAIVVTRGTYWIKNRRDGLYGENTRFSYSPLEYLTILVVGEGGKGNKVLAKNLPLLANYSYILDKEGTVQRQKYGEMNKFIDVSGKNHQEDL
jgi:hypothetical protein